MIVAIDPGPVESAVVSWDGNKIFLARVLPNHELRSFLIERWRSEEAVVIEMVASYGMPVGREVFETVLWIGRFQECCLLGTPKGLPRLVYRLEVKQHLCHDSRAKDSNIRQALIDRFGSPGTKKAPGTLYGIKSHLWAALAVAVYAHDNPVQ